MKLLLMSNFLLCCRAQFEEPEQISHSSLRESQVNRDIPGEINMHGGGSTAEYFRPYIHPYHHSTGPYGYQQMFHQHSLAAAAAAQYSQYGATSGSTSPSNQGSYSVYQGSGSSSGSGVIAPQAQKLLPFAAPSTSPPGLGGLNSNIAQQGIGAYTTTTTSTATHTAE